MTSLSSNQIRSLLGKLAAHIVVALVGLVVIGGATRVMEAGLACPDWPLCYGSFFPKGRMNLQIFLEWFHRLDAFFVGIAICLQFFLSLIYKSSLPFWLPWVNGGIFLLIALQGALGALTVVDLLPSNVVVGHLLLALTLVALMSGLTQRLLSLNEINPPSWWSFLSRSSLLIVIIQSVIGSRMATTWGAQKCLAKGIDCQWLDIHRISALPVSFFIFSFVFVAFIQGGWFRDQWPLLLFVVVLLMMQILLGVLSVHLLLDQPLVRVSHQLLACLLVASLAALSCRRISPSSSLKSKSFDDILLEVCHG